jgi:hypothetical protein
LYKLHVLTLESTRAGKLLPPPPLPHHTYAIRPLLLNHFSQVSKFVSLFISIYVY